MRLRSEKVKSLIVTQDRDFRTLVTGQLNSAAFVAEKVSAESLEECFQKIKFDKTVQNIVIDGSLFPEKDVIEFLKNFWNGIQKDQPFIILVALAEEQKPFKDVLKQAFPRIYFHAKPLEKRAFNEAFHQGNPINKVQGAPAKAQQPTPGPKAATDLSEEDKKARIAFFEASGHVKDTIDFINTVAKDFGAVAKFIDIGNRFNGVMGTFAFLKHKEGYGQLHSLSIMIDTITRTYEIEKWPQVQQEHFDFVLRAAKCAYMLLKQCREGLGPTDDQVQETLALEESFVSFQNLKRRESKSQSEVDDLLAELDNAS